MPARELPTEPDKVIRVSWPTIAVHGEDNIAKMEPLVGMPGLLG